MPDYIHHSQDGELRSGLTSGAFDALVQTAPARTLRWQSSYAKRNQSRSRSRQSKSRAIQRQISEDDYDLQAIPMPDHMPNAEPESHVVTLSNYEILGGTRLGFQTNRRESNQLDITTIHRWQLTSNLLSAYPKLLGGLNTISDLDGAIDLLDLGWNGNLLLPRIPNWGPTGNIYENLLLPGYAFGKATGRSRYSNAATALASGVYGGLHAAAWYAFFPSAVERWLWRSAGLVIAASGVLWAGGKFLEQLPFYMKKQEIRDLTAAGGNTKRRAARTGGLVIAALISFGILGLLLLLVAAARIFIVVEAFISLKLLPVEAYQTPSWILWIPHL